MQSSEVRILVSAKRLHWESSELIALKMIRDRLYSFYSLTEGNLDNMSKMMILKELKILSTYTEDLIRFVTKGAKIKFWKVEAVNPDSLPSQDINSDINEDYEKQKIKNRLQNSNRISTTDDRIAWAVAINNATKLVADINTDIDKKIKLIEDSTARIYELVKSLDTYLNNQTEENNEKSEEPYKSPVE